MSHFFIQGCPHCRRRVAVPVSRLGSHTVCRSCQRPFVARDESLDSQALSEPAHIWAQLARDEFAAPATLRPK